MSVIDAQRLVHTLNNNKDLAKEVLSQPKPDRERAWRDLGFDCSLNDLEAFQHSMVSTTKHETNLPRSWQSGGPCHKKCADIQLSAY